ncbi:MAG TPA: hypothetical protein VFZ53_24485 [Polyangiaceae bacterium]
MSFARLLVLFASVSCGPAHSPAAAAASREPSPCPSVPATTSFELAPVPPPACDEPPADSKERFVKVALFDCFSMAETKDLQSLRAWGAGGPEGAAWNVENSPLRCVVHLSAKCAGPATLLIRGNGKHLSDQRVGVRVGANPFEVVLPVESWGAGRDGWSDRPPDSVPYSTLLLTVSGFLACEAEYGTVNHPFADAFLAGFSEGE